MNPMTKALDMILATMPREILNQAFITQAMAECGSSINLETRIRETVIENRVLSDIDLFGGTETFIDLQPPVRAEAVDQFTMIYHIPDELTQNREIVQAYSIHFGFLGYQNAGAMLGGSTNAMGAETRKLLDSALKVPPASTSYLNLIAHNTIMTRFVYMPRQAAFLRCRLGFDESLSAIRTNTIPVFQRLCMLAVQAYVYNLLVIPMGQAYLSGGQTLGAFSEVINKYEGAEESYQAQLKLFRKVQGCYGDPEAKRRYLRSIIGSR